ncbi:hypothetical protein HPB47_007565 [Ixodes persulcatus]|uniref:Uncharacterized protein n=1 Tax=Ixodes persulcatus TaxID=34615 RepID=A0AC60P7C9_IXOPE|nr:hypothetical protein HPB47_007565 [Ixodes persulcatus]
MPEHGERYVGDRGRYDQGRGRDGRRVDHHRSRGTIPTSATHKRHSREEGSSSFLSSLVVAGAVHCVQNNDISNIVPIAVGSALAALVVIVLLAYLVGRSRSRQKGYQSV